MLPRFWVFQKALILDEGPIDCLIAILYKYCDHGLVIQAFSKAVNVVVIEMSRKFTSRFNSEIKKDGDLTKRSKNSIPEYFEYGVSHYSNHRLSFAQRRLIWFLWRYGKGTKLLSNLFVFKG